MYYTLSFTSILESPVSLPKSIISTLTYCEFTFHFLTNSTILPTPLFFNVTLKSLKSDISKTSSSCTSLIFKSVSTALILKSQNEIFSTSYNLSVPPILIYLIFVLLIVCILPKSFCISI